MRTLLLCISFSTVLISSFGQPNQISLGIFSGITSPFTFDSGINRDSRYQQKYQVKLTPIGISYGVDYQGYGFVVTPSITNIGQDMNIINSVGGFEGTREINMQYFQIPIALKAHVIDLAFFKVSVIAGVSAAYLIKGSENITHNYAKYRFPSEVVPFLPSTYVIEYDGIIAPEVKSMEIVSKKDFNKFQAFGSFGFRSDWDFRDAWRITFDIRANYGFLETRNDAYIEKTKAHQTIYDLESDRREVFASLNIGIARYIEVEKQRKPTGKFKPKKGSFTPGQKRKPKN